MNKKEGLIAVCVAILFSVTMMYAPPIAHATTEGKLWAVIVSIYFEKKYPDP